MGYYNDYLEHHGILGMKWGKKSGPPYPLSSQAHNAVTSQASPEERKAAAERGGGSAASLNTQNSGYKKGFNKEKAKKVAKALAIGTAVTAGVVGAKFLVATNPTIAMTLNEYGDKAFASLKKLPKAAGKAAVVGALDAAGSIAVYKITQKIDQKSADSQFEKDTKQVAKGAASGAIRGTTNSLKNDITNSGNDQSSGNNVDRNSNEYQHLFDGLAKDDPIRGRIKTAAKNGKTMEELRRIRNGEVIHSSVIDWTKSFKYYG